MSEWLLDPVGRFLDPWFLLFGLAPWLLLALRTGRRRATLAVASTDPLPGLPVSLRARFAWLPPALLAVGITALSVALARPYTRDVLPLRSEGVDILLLIDRSSSMQERDVDERGRQRRIDAAREQALAFAAAREHDRVGLMTFALFPDLRCPLTLDQDALAAFLRAVEPAPERSEENRTAIGAGLAQAVQFLEASTATTRLVVLLTDGEENVHQIEPADAARLAKDAGVKVHAIGLGNGVRVGFGMVQEPDFRALEAVATTTGGRFFRARSIADLAEVYAEIDREEKVELEDPRYRTTDWFAGPLAAGAVALLLALLLHVCWIREAP